MRTGFQYSIFLKLLLEFLALFIPRVESLLFNSLSRISQPIPAPILYTSPPFLNPFNFLAL